MRGERGETRDARREKPAGMQSVHLIGPLPFFFFLFSCFSCVLCHQSFILLVPGTLRALTRTSAMISNLRLLGGHTLGKRVLTSLTGLQTCRSALVCEPQTSRLFGTSAPSLASRNPVFGSFSSPLLNTNAIDHDQTSSFRESAAFQRPPSSSFHTTGFPPLFFSLFLFSFHCCVFFFFFFFCVRVLTRKGYSSNPGRRLLQNPRCLKVGLAKGDQIGLPRRSSST